MTVRAGLCSAPGPPVVGLLGERGRESFATREFHGEKRFPLQKTPDPVHFARGLRTTALPSFTPITRRTQSHART